MADVQPLRGLRYNTARAGSLPQLICPPYDVISPREQRELYARGPYNIVRLEYGAEEDRYAQAARAFRSWQQEGVLQRDERPALYFMRQRFNYRGTVYDRYGVTLCVRLEEFGNGAVLPHEATTEGPKRDRLALMETCQANFSPLMALYRDPRGRIAAVIEEVHGSTPQAEFEDEPGCSYTLWVVQDTRLIEAVRNALEDQPLYLADGHHRYETALRYRDTRRQQEGSDSPNAAYNFVMMTLVSLDDPGLLVLPYHRLVGNLDPPTFTRLRDRATEVFSIERAPIDASKPQALVELVERRGQGAMTVGLLGPDGEGPYLLTLRAPDEVRRYVPSGAGTVLRNVEAWVLQEVILRPVLGDNLEPFTAFSHEAEEAAQSVLERRHQMAFFLRPFPLDLFEAIMGAGLRLPPKSTYFYPKLPTGLVINPLQGEL